MKSLNERVQDIESRNARVEMDKAWEVSWARRMSIAVLTYVSVVIYLYIIHNNQPFLNALVPLVGYLLSTAALRMIRKVWEK